MTSPFTATNDSSPLLQGDQVSTQASTSVPTTAPNDVQGYLNRTPFPGLPQSMSNLGYYGPNIPYCQQGLQFQQPVPARLANQSAPGAQGSEVGTFFRPTTDEISQFIAANQLAGLIPTPGFDNHLYAGAGPNSQGVAGGGVDPILLQQQQQRLGGPPYGLTLGQGDLLADQDCKRTRSSGLNNAAVVPGGKAQRTKSGQQQHGPLVAAMADMPSAPRGSRRRSDAQTAAAAAAAAAQAGAAGGTEVTKEVKSHTARSLLRMLRAGTGVKTPNNIPITEAEELVRKLAGQYAPVEVMKNKKRNAGREALSVLLTLYLQKPVTMAEAAKCFHNPTNRGLEPTALLWEMLGDRSWPPCPEGKPARRPSKDSSAPPKPPHSPQPMAPGSHAFVAPLCQSVEAPSPIRPSTAVDLIDSPFASQTRPAALAEPPVNLAVSSAAPAPEPTPCPIPSRPESLNLDFSLSSIPSAMFNFDAEGSGLKPAMTDPLVGSDWAPSAGPPGGLGFALGGPPVWNPTASAVSAPEAPSTSRSPFEPAGDVANPGSNHTSSNQSGGHAAFGSPTASTGSHAAPSSEETAGAAAAAAAAHPGAASNRDELLQKRDESLSGMLKDTMNLQHGAGEGPPAPAAAAAAAAGRSSLEAGRPPRPQSQRSDTFSGLLSPFEIPTRDSTFSGFLGKDGFLGRSSSLSGLMPFTNSEVFCDAPFHADPRGDALWQFAPSEAADADANAADAGSALQDAAQG